MGRLQEVPGWQKVKLNDAIRQAAKKHNYHSLLYQMDNYTYFYPEGVGTPRRTKKGGVQTPTEESTPSDVT